MLKDATAETYRRVMRSDQKSLIVATQVVSEVTRGMRSVGRKMAWDGKLLLPEQLGKGGRVWRSSRCHVFRGALGGPALRPRLPAERGIGG